MENIQTKHIFAVLGGDLRQRTVADLLVKSGNRVKTFGVCGESISGAEMCKCAERAIEGSDVMILPLPVSRDNINLSLADACFSRVSLEELVKLAQKHRVSTILGGMIPENAITVAENNGIRVIDYYKSETLQEKNALPSAEGALMVAMENTDITVFGMRTLVCGFGRIGKKLAYILKRLGASVTVAARRDEVICEATMCGYGTLKIESDLLVKTEFDVIFNTVPAIIFTANALCKLIGNPIYIEIASKPGGVDVVAARDKGMRIINAPSLPGKYSPISAGEYIYETVIETLDAGGDYL